MRQWPTHFTVRWVAANPPPDTALRVASTVARSGGSSSHSEYSGASSVARHCITEPEVQRLIYKAATTANGCPGRSRGLESSKLKRSATRARHEMTKL
jgi:hypothetical protein